MIADAAWPAADPALLVDAEVTIAIQMAGKLRDTKTIAMGLDRQAVEAAALARPRIGEPPAGATTKKMTWAPARLVEYVSLYGYASTTSSEEGRRGERGCMKGN